MCGGGYAPPTVARSFPGLCPRTGLALQIFLPQDRTLGVAQKLKRALYGGAGGKAEADTAHPF